MNNGQTYFKNLAVFTPQSLLQHVWSFFIIIHERIKQYALGDNHLDQ